MAEKEDVTRENKVEGFGMRYLLGAIRRIFFQPAKFDNFKDKKNSDYKNCLSSKKQKTLTENLWSSGIVSNFLRGFYLCIGGKQF